MESKEGIKLEGATEMAGDAICASSSDISSPPVTGLVSAEKPRKGRPIGSQNKPRHNLGSENIGDRNVHTSNIQHV